MKMTTRQAFLASSILCTTIITSCLGGMTYGSHKAYKNLGVKLETILSAETENRSRIDELSIKLDDHKHNITFVAPQPTVQEGGNIITETYEYAGKFLITHYCGCRSCNGKWYGYPTASGADYKQGRTIAVDPNVIPLGTKVVIEGVVYVAEDTGSDIKGNRIDIFINDHDEALDLGKKHDLDVWTVVE